MLTQLVGECDKFIFALGQFSLYDEIKMIVAEQEELVNAINH